MADKLAELERRVARLELACAAKLKGLELEEEIERQYPQTLPATKKPRGD